MYFKYNISFFNGKILELVEASLIQPYSYLQLVSSTIIGVLVFSERLDIFILLGVMIVVFSGLYTSWREKVVKILKVNFFADVYGRIFKVFVFNYRNIVYLRVQSIEEEIL